MTNSFSYENTAVLAVDLQRENLEDGAWPVYGYQDVLKNNAAVIEAARDVGIPVIYTKHWLDPRGVDAMRYEPRQSDGAPMHSVAGGSMAEICEEVAPQESDIVIEKQKFTAFYGTKLDVVLSNLGIRHLIMTGVWTEACFETSVWDALWRDYEITIVKDACGSATATMHKAAIIDLANWLIGGRIMRAENVIAALNGKPYEEWLFQSGNALPYDLDTIDKIYDSL